MLPSGLSDSIAADEPLARFVHESNKFNKSGAKPGAFMPPANGLLSVARHPKEPLDGLRFLAEEFLPGVDVYGAAMLSAGDALNTGLSVIPEEPPPRHANITGWPTSSDPELQKAARKEKALKLASASEWVPFG